MQLKLLVPVIALLAAPAFAAQMSYPVSEEAYLKQGEAAFDAMDKNRDAQLQDNEVSAEFAQQINPFISKQTQEVCMKTGMEMNPQLKALGVPDAQQQEAKTLTRGDFVRSYTTMFGHFDGNKDRVITQDEAQAADQQMAQMCASAPEMLKSLEAMKTQALTNAMQQQGGGMPPEALQALQQMKQQGVPVPQPKAMPEGGWE